MSCLRSAWYAAIALDGVKAKARAEQLAPVIRELHRDGYTLNGMAIELEKRKVPTPGGGKWHRQIVKRIVERIDRNASTSAI